MFSNDERSEDLNLLTLPDDKAALTPFPPSCPVLVDTDKVGSRNGAASSNNNGGRRVGEGSYLAKVHSVYIDLGSSSRDNYYRVVPNRNGSSSDSQHVHVQSVPELSLQYAPGCTVSVLTSFLPPFVSESSPGTRYRDASVISCVPSQDGSACYYIIDVLPGPNDAWSNIQSTVPSSALRYRSPEDETKAEESNSVEANRPEGIAREDAHAVAAAVADAAPAALRDDAPHQEPAQAAEVDLGGGNGGSRGPHMIPVDEDGSANSPKVGRGADDDKKPPASAEADDDGSSNLSPVPLSGRKRSREESTDPVKAEEVVRRINIPNAIDAGKIKDVLVGPSNQIHQRMQSKLNVSIFILGLDDILYVDDPSSDSCIKAIDVLGNVGHITPKPGEKCVVIVVIRGSEHRVHAAYRVVNHLLVEKCYIGDDKDAIQKELRIIRQVRKKVSLSRTNFKSIDVATSPSLNLSDEPPVNNHATTNPKSNEERPVRNQATEANSKASGSKISSDAPESRNWSPPVPEETAGGSGAGASHAISWNPSPTQQTFCDEKPSFSYSSLSVDAKPASNKKPAASDHRYSQLANRQGTYQDHSCVATDDPNRLLMARPYYDGRDWVVKIRSPVDENTTFSCIVGSRGKAKKRMVQKFGGKCFITVEGGGIRGPDGRPGENDTPLHVTIKDRHRRQVGAAAKYISSTLNAMSNPAKDSLEMMFGHPYWDGKLSQWIINIRPPLPEEAATDLVIGPGRRRVKELRAHSGCLFIDVRGGSHGTPLAQDCPFHVHVGDKNRIVVEDTADHISRLLNEAASKMVVPRPEHQQRHHPSSSSTALRDVYHGHHRPAPAVPAGSGTRAYWTTTVWPPVDDYPSLDFYHRVIGTRGSTGHELENWFGVKIRVWGEQGSKKKPLRFVISGRSSQAVDDAALYIANTLMVPGDDSGYEERHTYRR